MFICYYLAVKYVADSAIVSLMFIDFYLSLMTVRPDIQNTAIELPVEMFTSTTLTCDVSSTDPSYSVIWYRDSTVIDISSTTDAKYDANGDALTIVAFVMSDDAQYICTATNGAGTSIPGVVALLTAFGK